MAFIKATKAQAKLRMAITGPSGAGKTKTALRVAAGLGKRIALADSEYKSASKYASEHEFDVDELNGETNPMRYIAVIDTAERDGYDVVILDSLTHAWDATKAVVDKKKQADKFNNGFSAWSEGSALWQKLLDKIQSSKIHVITTMRSKTEHIQEKDDRGKTVIRKVGLAPEVRDGTEYAFDVVLDLDHQHNGRITKTRCAALDEYFENKPGEALGGALLKWLTDGEKLPPPSPLADPDIRDALLADLKALGFTAEDLASVMGATKRKDMTVDQYAALDAMRHNRMMQQTESTEGAEA